MKDNRRYDMSLEEIQNGFYLLGLNDAVQNVGGIQEKSFKEFDIYTNLESVLTTSHSHTGRIANA